VIYSACPPGLVVQAVATTIQTVGGNGNDGFTVALVTR